VLGSWTICSLLIGVSPFFRLLSVGY